MLNLGIQSYSDGQGDGLFLSEGAMSKCEATEDRQSHSLRIEAIHFVSCKGEATGKGFALDASIFIDKVHGLRSDEESDFLDLDEGSGRLAAT